MSSDEFLLVGILDEKSAKGDIKLEELKPFLCEHIQVHPYYPILVDVLATKGILFEEKTKIDIQIIFKTISSAQFLRLIPSFFNKRVTKYTIKLIKAGLIIYTRGFLTMKQIGDGASIHQMKEFEKLSTGISCEIDIIHSILWIAGRTISDAVLEKWIEIHADYLEVKGTLMVHEFLYLLCNSKDRKEMYDKIPKLQMNPKMDKNIHLFHVDQEFHKTYKSPDFKMQHILGLNYNVDKAIYEGVAKIAPKIDPKGATKIKKQLMRTESGHEDVEISAFRKQLRSLIVTVEIKQRIKEANKKVSRLKLNGQNDYDELMGQEVSNLPLPLGDKEPCENIKKFPEINKIQLMKPQSDLLSPKDINQTSRLSKLRPQALFEYYQAKPQTFKLPVESTARLTTAATTRSKDNKQYMIKSSFSTKKFQYNPRDRDSTTFLETNISFENKTERRRNENYNLRIDTKTDNYTSLSDIFDEEFQIFENSSKITELRNRSNTALASSDNFIRIKSPRIFSSKV